MGAAVGAFGRDGRREATTRQAYACKKERQSRTPDQMRQRSRSAAPQRVNCYEVHFVLLARD
ncbi:MAG: hypothetical protein IPJ12_12255 [Betaproteobacteria bacterium]|nr:hypothetical protein [Betaproteobacteria bacterium]